jgi:hypothetical protein
MTAGRSLESFPGRLRRRDCELRVAVRFALIPDPAAAI